MQFFSTRRAFIKLFVGGIAGQQFFGWTGKWLSAAQPQEYYTSMVCVPRESTLKRVYASDSEFWDAFADPVAAELNNKFMSEGRILSVKTQLTRSKRACILTKVYRSEADYLEYRRQWKEASPNQQEKELQMIHYRPISRRLA